MGKAPYISTDSDETEDNSSSVENVKKKKKLSILKYTSGSTKKKKCRWHTRSEPEDSDRCQSGSRVRYQLPGILKHDRERECDSSEEDEDIKPVSPYYKDRCLVGRVPRPSGAKPGRGGGVAIIVRKNTSSRAQSLQAKSSTSSTKRRALKRLMKKSKDEIFDDYY